MRTHIVIGLIGMAVALAAFQALPRCTSVDPDTGKKGETITVKGENLGKTSVGELYLTDGQKDTKSLSPASQTRSSNSQYLTSDRAGIICSS